MQRCFKIDQHIIRCLSDRGSILQCIEHTGESGFQFLTQEIQLHIKVSNRSASCCGKIQESSLSVFHRPLCESVTSTVRFEVRIAATDDRHGVSGIGITEGAFIGVLQIVGMQAALCKQIAHESCDTIWVADLRIEDFPDPFLVYGSRDIGCDIGDIRNLQPVRPPTACYWSLHNASNGTACMDYLTAADIDADVTFMPNCETWNLRDGVNGTFLRGIVVHRVRTDVRMPLMAYPISWVSGLNQL